MRVDYLTVTVPQDSADQTYKDFMAIVSSCGGVQRRVPPDSDWQIFSVGSSGAMKVIPKGDILIFSSSGDALRVMREKGVYTDYLWSFAEVPHRVTSMDIAHDVSVYTPPVLRSLWRKAHSKTGIHLSRKRVPSKNVVHHVNKGAFDGARTGTLELGGRKSEVHCKVYDKRQERFTNAGIDLGHWLTRYELTLTSKMGITLRDAHIPDPVFWHFMREVISPGTDIDPWSPCEGGFDLPPKVASLPAARLKARLESSAEFLSWVALADEIGPSGRQYLSRLLTKSLEGVPLPIDQTDSDTKHEGS